MKDAAILVVLLLAFATFATSHIAIAVRLLLLRDERWRSAVVMIAPPLAPLWAYRRSWRFSAVAWIASAIVYTAALIVALR
ncbi:MAG: hypothetical protein U0441_21760 [Polyangiaceae bacterium]